MRAASAGRSVMTLRRDIEDHLRAFDRGTATLDDFIGWFLRFTAGHQSLAHPHDMALVGAVESLLREYAVGQRTSLELGVLLREQVVHS
jgi:hypothetical protein